MCLIYVVLRFLNFFKDNFKKKYSIDKFELHIEVLGIIKVGLTESCEPEVIDATSTYHLGVTSVITILLRLVQDKQGLFVEDISDFKDFYGLFIHTLV